MSTTTKEIQINSKPGAVTKPLGKQIQPTKKTTVQRTEGKGAAVDEHPNESDEGHLTPGETNALKECEEIISKGIASFFETGRALLTIQKGKLYRDQFETWEEYIAERWGIARSTSYAQIEAAKVMATLSTIGGQNLLPENERQVRPLTRLKTSAEQIKAWERACELSDGEAASGEIVMKVVDDMRGGGARNSNSGSAWEKTATKRLRKAGYDKDPVQPVTMGKEGIHFLDKKNSCAIKLVDRLKLETVAFIIALKEHDSKAIILMNGDRFKAAKLDTGEDGSITGLCDEAHAVLIANLGLLVTREGKLFGEGTVDGDLNLTLNPVTTDEAKALEQALGGKIKGKK
jgi:hypothetical protein